MIKTTTYDFGNSGTGNGQSHVWRGKTDKWEPAITLLIIRSPTAIQV